MFLACEPMAYHICWKTMLSYPYVKMPMNECCLTVLTVENTFSFAIENQKLNVNCSLVQNNWSSIWQQMYVFFFYLKILKRKILLFLLHDVVLSCRVIKLLRCTYYYIRKFCCWICKEVNRLSGKWDDLCASWCASFFALIQIGHWGLLGFCFFRRADFIPPNIMWKKNDGEKR